MRIRAVVFDVDGTLYRQAPVRMWMAAEAGAYALTRGSVGWTTLQVVKAYREAQEILRERNQPYSVDAQLGLAAARTGTSPQRVAQIVDEWMFERPLKY